MDRKTEILNIYRHAKGLFESAERVARSEGVIRCSICRGIHAINEKHTPLAGDFPTIVEHKFNKK